MSMTLGEAADPYQDSDSAEDSDDEIRATFWLCEKDAIGWRQISETMAHWPRKLAGFAPAEDTDEDSGWREWDTPADMTFEITRPGGRRVSLTSTGEREL